MFVPAPRKQLLPTGGAAAVGAFGGVPDAHPRCSEIPSISSDARSTAKVLIGVEVIPALAEAEMARNGMVSDVSE